MLSATVGACLRAAAAVLALGAFITSPSDQMLSYRVWRRVAWSTSTQPAASASGDTRMKSGAVWGGQTCSMSNSTSTVVGAPSGALTAKVAFFAGPSTAIRVWKKFRVASYLRTYSI